jgi:hypothetical protein
MDDGHLGYIKKIPEKTQSRESIVEDNLVFYSLFGFL